MSKPRKPRVPSHTETLGEALRAIDEVLVQGNGYEFADRQDWDPFWDGGLAYGATKTRSVELIVPGKPRTKRFLTASIYRMESGRYEVVAYTL